MSSEYTGFEVAIIGMAGRFPGSKNINELWNNLCNGKNLISHFSDEELRESGIPEEYLEDKNYVKAKGILDNVEGFDAGFFNMYPKEAEVLDPQQRLFLECSWEALEDTGYIPDECDCSVGVFGGIGMNTYIMQHLQNTDIKTSAESYQLSLGNDKDFVTTRVSYKLNLKGPSIDIQSACSTSLVAVHVACMNLINYQCDLAIAGGSTVSFPHKAGYHYQEGMILSPDGHCCPFDKNANGTVASNGVGIVILKRLEEAINDGDDIYAVIKGSAYNNDGAIKVGYTAPGVEGQVNVISSAKAVADIPYESIGYIETHGTGTSLGDPIEIEALTEAFKDETDKKQFCAIGSVKSNLGHLDTAAGVTGLIKAALSIYHKKLVPSINYEQSNSKINFTETPFFVNTELKNWESNTTPLRAAVSSFGIGGTNAHIILEEAPKINSNGFKSKLESIIIPISANDKVSLSNYENEVKNYLLKTKTHDILAYQFQKYKKEFNYRGFAVLNGSLGYEYKDDVTFQINNGKIIENPEVIFMFTGQGAQYVNMFKGLYDGNEIFKKYLNKCFYLFDKNHNLKLKDLIFPHSKESVNNEKLKQTEITQPALFAVEYSLAKTFIEYGIIPISMVGHSIGEYTAACISEVLNLEDAVKIVYHRGSLMQKLEKGSMLSVQLPESDLLGMIPDNLDLSVVNSPKNCVVSGRIGDIRLFKKELETEGIASTILHTSHAFHSRMMDPVLNEFKSVLNNVKFSTPKIQYMSNITGKIILDEEATSVNYYVNHLRYTIRFSENIASYENKSNKIFLEIGPGKVLTSLAKLSTQNEGYFINSVSQSKLSVSDIEVFLSALGHLWLRGVTVKWDKLYDGKPNKIHVPTYPFNKKQYILKSNDGIVKVNKRDLSDYLYTQTWKRLEKFSKKQLLNNYEHILVIGEETTEFNNIKKIFNKEIIKISNSDVFNKVTDYNYKLNINNKKDLENLINHLSESDNLPELIIYTDCLKINCNGSNHYLSFMSLISNILPELTHKLDIIIITKEIFDVIGNESIDPEQSAILGVVRVIHQENKNVNIKLIDIEDINLPLDNVIINSLNEKGNNIYAVRGNSIWIQHFENVSLSSDASLLKAHGTYVITGGLGKIGLSFAELFAVKYQANLILIDQIGIPERHKWNELVTSDSSNKLIKKIIELEKKSNSLHVAKCDITDKNNFIKILAEIQSNRNIDGIIHAAGIIGDKTINFINNFDVDNYWLQYNPKVLGLKNIIEFAKEHNPDFILVQSSLSSILGGIGFSNYAAINNVIDRSISTTNIQEPRFISANWDAWKFSDNIEGISISQGKKILEMILNKNTPSNIVISKSDLHESINKWENKVENRDTFVTTEVNQERPELSTEYVEPEDEIEKEIYFEWKKLLGIDKIGVDDNFFELGGDSLIGTQLVSRIRNKFNSEFSLTAVFENATIKGIANLVKNDNKRNDSKGKVNDILSVINDMSDEEAARLLREKENNNG